MSKWTYIVLTGLLWACIVVGLFQLITEPPVAKVCLDGVVMIKDKKENMYVQYGLIFPTRCMPIDTD